MIKRILAVIIGLILLPSPSYADLPSTNDLVGYLLEGGYYSTECKKAQQMMENIPKKDRFTGTHNIHYYSINVEERSTVTWILVNPSIVSYRLLVSEYSNPCENNTISFTNMHCNLRTDLFGTGFDSQLHKCSVTVEPGKYYAAVETSRNMPGNNIGFLYFVTVDVTPV